MHSQTWSLVLFLAVTALSALIAVNGLQKGKQAYLGLALLVGIVGAVLVGISTNVSVHLAGTAFAVVFGLLGILITADGIAKRERELWLQGLIQFFIGGLLLTYSRAPTLIRDLPRGRPIAVIVAMNLPWVILAIILLAIIMRGGRKPRC